MKSVTVNPRSKFHAQTIADLFNVPVADEMAIPMEAIDRAVEDYLDGRELSPPDSAASEYAPIALTEKSYSPPSKKPNASRSRPSF